MAERTNFLIGYGERLASDVTVPPSGGPKSHPYTFGEAQRRLSPKVKKAADDVQHLPEKLCPGNRVSNNQSKSFNVLMLHLVTLHLVIKGSVALCKGPLASKRRYRTIKRAIHRLYTFDENNT